MRGNRGIEVIEVVIFAALICIVGVIAWLGYEAATSDKTVLLKKEWTCTKTEIRTTMQAVPMGKGIMMMPTTSSVCVEYKMVGGN